jgi:hypothetical protein
LLWIAEHSGWLLLLCGAAVVATAWLGLRRGSMRLVACAAGPLAVGLLAMVIAWQVVTPAEHAEQTVERLVAAVVAGDVAAAKDCFSERASIHVGRLNSPGEGRERIDRAFDSFAGRHRIESNTLLSLDANTLAADVGEVEIACRTTTASSLGAVPTRWHFEVVLETDGVWRILRITWLRVGNEVPSLSLL